MADNKKGKQSAAQVEAAKEPEMVLIRFDGFTAAESHGDKGMVDEYDQFGNKKEVCKLTKPFEILKGEEKEIPKADFDFLVSRKTIRTAEEQKERDELVAKNQPVYKMSDEEKQLFLNDLPYEVREIKEE